MIGERSRSYCKVVWVLLVIGCFAATAAVAGAAGEKQEKKVRVSKVVVVGDGDGDSHEYRKIFINRDGETHTLSGDDYVWVGDSGDGAHYSFINRGKGGFLGVGLTELTPELRSHFGVPEDAGVMVSKVMEDSPALAAGVEVGDILTEVNGETVSTAGALAKAVRRLEDGEVAALGVWRDGKIQTLNATVEGGRKHHRARAIALRCADGEGDCQFDFARGMSVDCGEEDCEVRVNCEDGDCTCTVNGEARDCSAIPGVHVLHP